MSGQNIVVSLTLKGNGKGLVGEIKVSEKELSKLGDTAKRTGKEAATGAKGVDKFGNDAKQTANETRRLNKEAQNLGRGFGDVQRRAQLLKAAIFALATGAMARLGGSFIDAASTTERYATTLKVVLGDVGEANRLFDDMATFAGRVPFEFENIMGAATQLSGVVRGGVDEINQLIPIIADIAAATGLSIEDTTSNMIRAYSAGIGAADLFRDRGISATLGFQASVSYSAEETMKLITRSWEDGSARYKGATEELVKTWAGQVSMMSDKWFLFRNQVMDAGPFDYLKTSFKIMNEDYQGSANDMRDRAEKLGKDVVDVAKQIALGTAGIIDIASPAVSDIGGALDIFWQGFKDLPSWMQQTGLVGALLFGRVGWAVVAGGSALNELGNTLDRATQEALKGTDAPDWLKNFTHSPTNALFGDGAKKSALPDASFSRKNGGEADLSMHDRLAAIFAEIDARIAADRKTGIAPPANGPHIPPPKDGGTLNTPATNRVSDLEIERDMLYQVAAAREVYGKDATFMVDAIKAETDARRIGLEVGSETYDRYIDSSMAIAELKRETEGATNADRDRVKNIKNIKNAYDELPKSYSRAREAALKWHAEALAGLDKTKAGFFDFKNMADDVLRVQLSDAYRESLAASEQWADGVERAYLKIEDRAFNLAAQSENMFQRIDQAAEDSYINMVKGTESVSEAFAKMADNILTEMLRISYQQNIAQPLLGGLKGLVKGLFGGGAAGDAGLSPQYQTVQYGHGGAIIGAATMRGQVPASVFAGAPRHHQGTPALKAGEVPFIGMANEGIFTPRQMDNADRLLGAAMNAGKTEINIIDQRGADAPDVGIQQRREGGVNIIDIVVPAIEQASDSGRLDASFQRNHGARRQPVPGS